MSSLDKRKKDKAFAADAKSRASEKQRSAHEEQA
jgi:hypothetical protein